VIGSKYMAKKLSLEDLKKLYNDKNQTAYEYIQERGFSLIL